MTAPTPDALRARLEALRGGRGFLLPHHGALAAAAPDLHAAYEQMYGALTLTERHLLPLEKEFIWLAILVALRESVGTHHVHLFRQAGGSDAQARVAFQLAGYAGAAEAFAFLAEHWSGGFPTIDPEPSYLDGAATLCGSLISPDLAHLALAAVHAATGRRWGVAAHVVAAYGAGIAEGKLVDALSLIIWPAGVNRFVAACTVWHDLMRAGRVIPSPLFQAWADMPGQGAFKRP